MKITTAVRLMKNGVPVPIDGEECVVEVLCHETVEVPPADAAAPKPEPDIDREAQIRHFQSINAANVTNMVNVFLTLAVGVIAFAVNMMVGTTKPLGWLAGHFIAAAFSILFLDTFVGIAILFTRMEDYRRTILGAVLIRDYPGLVTDEKLIKKAIGIKKGSNFLNKATNILGSTFSPSYSSSGSYASR